MESSDNQKLPSPIERYLTALHQRYAALDEGQVATYIPELAKADPRWFGISVATPDGHVYEVGDTRQPFTIQSISKPFAYGLALGDVGQPGVLEKVGIEPSGEAFNSISLAPGTGCPLNPMINAGAIATTSLVRGDTAAQKVRRLLDVFSTYAGRPLGIDEGVYQSERETGHRNRAIGHMLRNFDIITEDPTTALDAYFQQCSIEVTCRDLAVMAATLANEGVNPVTGERAIRRELVDAVMSVMMSCGMYDYASAGMFFGELAVVRRTPRTADVRADTVVECYALPRRELEDLEHTDPTTRAVLLGNVLRHVAEMVALLTVEVTALLEA